MSVNFTNYSVRPYNGSLQARSVGICTPSKYPPRVVPVILDWTKYPTGGVEVNLTGAGVLDPLDFIRSVVVDNLGQSSSIELFFPDTQFTLAVSGGSILSGFAFTFQQSVLIFNTGTPLQGKTTVYLCNFLVDTYEQNTIPKSLSLWLTSSTGPGQQSFSAPALGSQKTTTTFSLGTILSPQLLFGGARVSGRIIVTQMFVKITGNYAPFPGQVGMIVEIIDNLGVRVSVWQWYSPNDMSIFPMLMVGEERNIQMALDATKAYSIQNKSNALPGFCEFTYFWDWVDGI